MLWEFFFQLIIQDILIESGKCTHDGLYIIKTEFWSSAEVYKIYSSLKDRYSEVTILYSTHMLLCKMREHRQKIYVLLLEIFRPLITSLMFILL